MKTNVLKAALLALCFTPLSILAEPTHWSYEGEGAPEHWGEISNEFKTCQTGMRQSPIDIQTQSAQEEYLAPLDIKYIDGPVELLNNGHTLQAKMTQYASDSILLNGYPYALEQFHFHAPSEHTIDSKHFALEMHLLHKNHEGKIVVVAVMFNIGEPNEALSSLWQSIPLKGNYTPLYSPVDINQLLPADKTWWRYSGSLTTPPCSENVTWIIMKSPLTLSQEQLNEFMHVMHHDNNRPVQPLNGRVVAK